MPCKYYLTFKPRGGSMTFYPTVTRLGAVIYRSVQTIGTNMKRTGEEIAAELTALEALSIKLPNARRNLAIVAAAISDRLTHDQVYDQYDTEDPEFQYALDAVLWLSGDNDTKPSSGWD